MLPKSITRYMTITIMRRLKDGGETSRTWPKTTPRNLITAAKLYKSSIVTYDNVDLKSCWIEIDGVKVDSYVVNALNIACENRAEYRSWGALVPTATEMAAIILDRMATTPSEG